MHFWGPGRDSTPIGHAMAPVLGAMKNPAGSKPPARHGALVRPSMQRRSAFLDQDTSALSKRAQTGQSLYPRGNDPITCDQTFCEFDREWARSYICAGPQHRQKSEPRPRNPIEDGNSVFVSAADQGPVMAINGN